ncbi:MAG: HAD family hydrolase [Luteolibacter sp.]
MPTPPPKGIALFDLDGTLIAWDCQVLFRHFILRHEPWRRIFLPVFIAFLPLAKLLGAGGMKQVFLSYLWRMTPEQLDPYSQEFARSILPKIYEEVRVFLEEHRRNGDFLILASASPEFYVKHIGQELGFNLTLGTPVEIGKHCPFFPSLENHKGSAKVDRLHNVLPPEFFNARGKLINCHGYTDSHADLPMLELCDQITVVNPTKKLRAHQQPDWRVVKPSRPWKSRLDFAWQMFRLLNGW